MSSAKNRRLFLGSIRCKDGKGIGREKDCFIWGCFNIMNVNVVNRCGERQQMLTLFF